MIKFIVAIVLSCAGLLACGGATSNAPATPIKPPTTAPNANFNPPTVQAGSPQSLDEATEVLLQGQAQAVNGRAIRRVQWRQASSDSIPASLPADPAQAKLSFTAPQVDADTLLTFIFRGEDDAGQFAEDKTTVLVRNVLANRLPVAVPGADRRVPSETREFALNGCSSYDPDGTVAAFAWSALRGDTETALASRCDVTVTLAAAQATETAYRFRLRVTDNQGAQQQAVLTLTQAAHANNQAPQLTRVEANPTPARPSETVALRAAASDGNNDNLAYEWGQKSGTTVFLVDHRSANPTFTAPANAADLVFSVTVTDGLATASQTLSVPVRAADSYSTPSAQACLLAPTQLGCASALKRIIPDNNASPSLGLSAGIDSAGACNPSGLPQWPHFTGMLHEHTAYSDGFQLTKPADVFAAGKQKGWSFAFSTDHSDNMGLPVPVVAAKDPAFCTTNPLACIVSDPDNLSSNLSKWDAINVQALNASTPTFTAMRGFEWTSDRFGHANVLFSQNFINPKTGPGYLASMEGFWSWFLTPASLGGGADGLMVFNHPGREDALHGPLTQAKLALAPLFDALRSAPLPSNTVTDLLTAPGDPAYVFNDFNYVPSADYRVVGIEVFGKGSEYDSNGKKQSWFGYALDKGWYLAPTGSEDHHEARWGDRDLPKTVLIARTQSRADLREALLARRAYAVAQDYNDVLMNWTAKVDGQAMPMGSRLSLPASSIVFNSNVSTRAGRQSPLTTSNTVIELMSSLANNSESYSVLQSVKGNSASFTLANATKQQWAFIRVRDAGAGNRIVAVSAPIWFKQASSPLPTCNNGR
ncbi:MAG: hypothetical protein ABIR53_01855 [Paraperlucidibaca sp.]